MAPVAANGLRPRSLMFREILMSAVGQVTVPRSSAAAMIARDPALTLLGAHRENVDARTVPIWLYQRPSARSANNIRLLGQPRTVAECILKLQPSIEAIISLISERVIKLRFSS